eukprot:GHVR01082311.1.p1 GENE.GHVR01082311.1~~GHVR01082311.1.p1  ORF type:complete len:112 (-),score=50.20 GHVR01082311.1:135-470(-)
MWESMLLPQWHTEQHRRVCGSVGVGQLRTLKVERVWRQGIPHQMRGIVWPIAIGNPFHLTPELYAMLLDRADRMLPKKQTQAIHLESTHAYVQVQAYFHDILDTHTHTHTH